MLVYDVSKRITSWSDVCAYHSNETVYYSLRCNYNYCGMRHLLWTKWKKVKSKVFLLQAYRTVFQLYSKLYCPWRYVHAFQITKFNENKPIEEHSPTLDKFRLSVFIENFIYVDIKIKLLDSKVGRLKLTLVYLEDGECFQSIWNQPLMIKIFMMCWLVEYLTTTGVAGAKGKRSIRVNFSQ